MLVLPLESEGANIATGRRVTRAMMTVVTEVVALEPAYATPMSAACPVIEDAQTRFQKAASTAVAVGAAPPAPPAP